ncbi:MAG: peptidylprolyl isomerase [Proteobacteria bacterium]|nr:peptidylprolyl isomerase [Pseudomonadota bacterium]
MCIQHEPPTIPLAPFRRAGHVFFTLAAAALLTASLAVAQDAKTAAPAADAVVARINGSEIRESDLAMAEEDVGQNLPQGTPEQKRDYLVTYLTDIILVAKAAEGKNIADGDLFKRRLAFARNKVLMEIMLQEEAAGAVGDAQMRKVYAEAVKEMKAEPEVRASHILVATEEEAKAILAELRGGGDFAAIAKKKSKDPSAATEGGDLGYFTADQMVPEFSAVAFKLEKGSLSEPVKSQFGWHVIRVEDKRTKEVPEFDKVKEQIQSFVMRRAQADLITKLRGEGKVERLDKPADAKKETK